MGYTEGVTDVVGTAIGHYNLLDEINICGDVIIFDKSVREYSPSVI